MFTSLACFLALALPPGEGGKLEIANLRGTYGYLGAVRPPKGILPGDVGYIAFDIKNLKLDEKGRGEYSIAVEVRNGKGDLVYKQKPRNAVAQNYLGGNSLPCAAHLDVPADMPPGEATLKITITDRTTKETATVTHKGKVLPADFGLVRVGTFADREMNVPVPPVGVIGQTLFVNFSVVGFGRDKETKQPDLHLSMRVLDDKGKATFQAPMTGEVKKGIDEEIRLVPMQFGITLNRAGRFTVEVSATCKHCNKTSVVTFPLRVETPE
jgi:hypothetical protein